MAPVDVSDVVVGSVEDAVAVVEADVPELVAEVAVTGSVDVWVAAVVVAPAAADDWDPMAWYCISRLASWVLSQLLDPVVVPVVEDELELPLVLALVFEADWEPDDVPVAELNPLLPLACCAAS